VKSEAPGSLICDGGVKFVLLYHYGRCGSTVITEILEQLPEVVSLSEYLSLTSLSLSSTEDRYPATWDRISRKDNSGHTGQSVGEAICADLKAITKTRSVEPRIVVFELKFTDFVRGAIKQDISVFMRELRVALTNLQVVHLYRLNPLRLTISHHVGHTRGLWHTQHAVSPERFTIDIPRFVSDMAGFIGWTLKSKAGIGEMPGLTLCYERDIFSDPYIAVERLLGSVSEAAAQVRYRTTPVKLRKTNDFPLASLVENIDQIIAAVPTMQRFPQIVSTDQQAILHTGLDDFALFDAIWADLQQM